MTYDELKKTIEAEARHFGWPNQAPNTPVLINRDGQLYEIVACERAELLGPEAPAGGRVVSIVLTVEERSTDYSYPG